MALQNGSVTYLDPLSCAIFAVYKKGNIPCTNPLTHIFIELTELSLGREAATVGVYLLNGQHPLYLQKPA